jgi:TonB family protein
MEIIFVCTAAGSIEECNPYGILTDPQLAFCLSRKVHSEVEMHHPSEKRSEQLMLQARFAIALLFLASVGLRAEDVAATNRQAHQGPDKDGIYYVGPEVTAPLMVRTVPVPYPDDLLGKQAQGMTVLAMVIGADGVPKHIQILHKHGDPFDQAAVAAVQHSTFEPGRLAGTAVPVWIDVRVVFHANRSQAVPQVLITERDLAAPDASQLEDKHHNPLKYTPPIAIHTVDADFVDPFVKHPFVLVAVVSVLVSETGMPKEVRVTRGLGFGLDQKAEAAVWQYKFLPATRKGSPVAARRDVLVEFAKF